MKRTKQITLLGILFLALAACAPAATQTPTEVPVQPAATEVAQVEQPAETMDYCLDCHGSKDQVMALAKPEVVAESESKGVG